MGWQIDVPRLKTADWRGRAVYTPVVAGTVEDKRPGQICSLSMNVLVTIIIVGKGKAKEGARVLLNKRIILARPSSSVAIWAP